MDFAQLYDAIAELQEHLAGQHHDREVPMEQKKKQRAFF